MATPSMVWLLMRLTGPKTRPKTENPCPGTAFPRRNSDFLRAFNPLLNHYRRANLHTSARERRWRAARMSIKRSSVLSAMAPRCMASGARQRGYWPRADRKHLQFRHAEFKKSEMGETKFQSGRPHARAARWERWRLTCATALAFRAVGRASSFGRTKSGTRPGPRPTPVRQPTTVLEGVGQQMDYYEAQLSLYSRSPWTTENRHRNKLT